jgi:hypothetical protein
MNENIEKYLLLTKKREGLEKIHLTSHKPNFFSYKKRMIFFVVFFISLPIAFYFYGFESELYPISTSLLFLSSALYAAYNLISMLLYLSNSKSLLSVFFEKGIKSILPILFLSFFRFYNLGLQDNFSNPLSHYFFIISSFLISLAIINCIPFLFFKYTKFKSQNEITEKLSIVEKEIETTEELLINDKESFSFILNDKTDKFATLKNNEKFKQVFFDILKEEKKLNDFSMENE